MALPFYFNYYLIVLRILFDNKWQEQFYLCHFFAIKYVDFAKQNVIRLLKLLNILNLSF